MENKLQEVKITLPDGQSYSIPAFTDDAGAIWVRNADNEIQVVYDPVEKVSLILGGGFDIPSSYVELCREAQSDMTARAKILAHWSLPEYTDADFDDDII